MSEALQCASQLVDMLSKFKTPSTERGQLNGAIEELRRLAPMEAELQQALNLCERLKLEAQCHAQEARTANATIAEIYQAVSGGTGEPGNWHGAQPVVDALQRTREELATCRELLAEIRASLDKPIEQLETMPMRKKEELVMGWFAEDWAISKGLDMLHDYEKLRGMK